ncbi:MAG: hypothetical protein RLY58_2315, partial [Pseudomonadota bacterium]
MRTTLGLFLMLITTGVLADSGWFYTGSTKKRGAVFVNKKDVPEPTAKGRFVWLVLVQPSTKT